MKKVILFTLIFISTVGLIACGDGNGTTGNSTITAEESVEEGLPEHELTNQPTEAENETIGGIDRILEGTVVAILEDELLFVDQLNLSKEALEKTAEEWFLNSNVYRLTGIEAEVEVGTEIRISIGITTKSIPPLAPVVDYEILD